MAGTQSRYEWQFKQRLTSGGLNSQTAYLARNTSAAMEMPGVTDSWRQLAVVDRLVELGYLCEVRQEGGVAGQNRIFRWVGP